MQYQTLERRLDLLKLEGNGLLRPEIVKELSTKYECSKQTVYNDFKSKPVWQPKIEEMERALLKILNRHEQLYRKASLSYIQADSPKLRIFALNLLRTLNKDAFDMLQTTGKISQVPLVSEIHLKWLEDESNSGDKVSSS